MNQTTTKAKNPIRDSSPVGCNKPLMTNVSAAEFMQVEDIAKRENRTRAAAARMLILLGLEQYQQRQANETQP